MIHVRSTKYLPREVISIPFKCDVGWNLNFLSCSGLSWESFLIWNFCSFAILCSWSPYCLPLLDPQFWASQAWSPALRMTLVRRSSLHSVAEGPETRHAQSLVQERPGSLLGVFSCGVSSVSYVLSKLCWGSFSASTCVKETIQRPPWPVTPFKIRLLKGVPWFQGCAVLFFPRG